MATRIIPAVQVTVCDRCKVEDESSAAALHPRGWGKLKLNFGDGTWKEFDLCRSCTKAASETVDQFLADETQEAA